MLPILRRDLPARPGSVAKKGPQVSKLLQHEAGKGNEREDRRRTDSVAEAGKPVRRGRPKLPSEEKLKRMISKLPTITEDYAQEVIEKLKSVKVNPDLA